MPAAARRSIFAGLLALAILACNLPIAISPTQDPGAAFTSAALTVAAAVNQTLIPSPISQPPTMQSFTPVTLDTAPPAPTFTATLSPTPIFTSTTSIPMISVTVDTNCRVGPGKAYDYIGGLFVGQTAEVYGKNPGGDYFYIRLPDNPNIYCWVTGQYATITGNASVLPVFTPPPTPTPAPSFEFAFVSEDACVGWWLNFRLKNTGSVAFKSFSLAIKDLDTSVTVTSSGNGFTELGGCMVSSTLASLDPSKITNLSGPAFSYNPNNHNMRATLTLCTLTGLAGQCVKNTINFKP
jgi:hypothetical protein